MVSEVSIQSSTVIGVSVSRRNVYQLLFQCPHERLLELAKANEKAKTTLFFYSLHDVDVNKKRISGVYYNSSTGRWERGLFPYPNVLYKRGGLSLSSEHMVKKYLKFQHQLAKSGVKMLNYQLGFNKWDLYKHLKKTTLRKHLPKTMQMKSPKVLEYMIKRYPSIYVKAARGRRGKQVVKVTKLTDGSFEYRYFNGSLSIQKAKNIVTLYRQLKAYFGNREIIAQEAIDLIKINHSVVDFRAELQRNGNGKLEIIGIPVRVSQTNSPITTHANSYVFEDFFAEYMNYSKNQIQTVKKKVETFLKNVYLEIEKIYGPVGEIGIDFAIDQKGKLKLIECNSQSAKVSLCKAYDQEAVDSIFLNPLEYAKYLTAH